jgi:hypothetical protein
MIDKQNNSPNKLAFSLIELSVVILIIGILVLGVTQGSRILNESKLKSAISLTQSSPVSSMENLVLWLETTDASKIAVGSVGSGVYGNATDGSLVTGWADKNPQNNNGYTVSSAVNTNRPTYVKNGINGLPSLSFDGASSFLSKATGVIPAEKKDYTIVAVWQNKEISNDQVIFVQQDIAQSCAGNYAGLMLTSGRGIASWGCGANGNADQTAFSYNLKTPYITIARRNKNLSSNNSVLYLNNGQPNIATTDTSLKLVSDIVYIGAYAGSFGARMFNGYISEIIVFDRALADYEITAIQQYLSSKYGISLS